MSQRSPFFPAPEEVNEAYQKAWPLSYEELAMIRIGIPKSMGVSRSPTFDGRSWLGIMIFHLGIQSDLYVCLPEEPIRPIEYYVYGQIPEKEIQATLKALAESLPKLKGWFAQRQELGGDKYIKK